MHRIGITVVAGVLAMGVSGCDAVTDAVAAGPNVPSIDEKLAMLTEFNNSTPAACADAWVEIEEDEDPLMAGSTVQVCSGSMSSETPHVIILMRTASEQLAAGTMRFVMRHHSHPMAYGDLRQMILAAGGIEDEADLERLRTELLRMQSQGQNYPSQGATPTFYPLEYDGIGSGIEVAPNHPASGWMTVRVNVPG